MNTSTNAANDTSLPFAISITPQTPAKLPDYLDLVNNRTQDYPFCTAVIDGEFWIMMKNGYPQYGGKMVTRYKGTNIDDAVKQPDGTFNLTNPKWGKVINPYILGGMWYDSASKTLYAPLHCEYDSVYGGGNERLNRQTHLASSTDKGLTWNYEGPIITRDVPGKPRPEPEYSGSLWNGGEGDFRLYADVSHGYVYVYTSHNMWPKPGNKGPRFWATHVARCAISDKMAPGKWKKFYNGVWSEPGLGGKASYVQGENVIFSHYLGKYVSFNIGGGLSACTDLAKQDWTPSFRIPGGNWVRNDIWAVTTLNADKKDAYACDSTAYIYCYWMGKPSSVYRIDFGPGETPDTLGYTGSGVAAPILANTMNPIRPYGEPLYDNADPIESRRVRKVSCESPEMSYSGDWTSQASPVKAKLSGIRDNSVSFRFKGTGVYWRAATGPDCGKADVYLDGVFQKTRDLYGDYTPYQFGFIKTDLDARDAHTIKIVVKGEKNPKSSGTAVKHMSFEYSAQSYQASDGFSSVMGKNQWHYLWRSGSVDGDLEYDFRKNVYAKSGGGVAVGPDYQTPDDTNDAFRKWVAPHDGTIRIEGQVLLNNAAGDGIKAKILCNKTEVWEQHVVTYDHPSSHDFTVVVAKGDPVYFCVSKNTVTVNGKTNWDPVITFLRN